MTIFSLLGEALKGCSLLILTQNASSVMLRAITGCELKNKARVSYSCERIVRHWISLPLYLLNILLKSEIITYRPTIAYDFCGCIRN